MNPQLMQMQQIQNMMSQLAVYDYIHEKQIEKAGEVKAMQALFLGS